MKSKQSLMKNSCCKIPIVRDAAAGKLIEIGKKTLSTKTSFFTSGTAGRSMQKETQHNLLIELS